MILLDSDHATFLKYPDSERGRRIAAIALVNDSLLLSANRVDFGRVPGLGVANWLD